MPMMLPFNHRLPSFLIRAFIAYRRLIKLGTENPLFVLTFHIAVTENNSQEDTFFYAVRYISKSRGDQR
jgi:hypothetical protein